MSEPCFRFLRLSVTVAGILPAAVLRVVLTVLRILDVLLSGIRLVVVLFHTIISFDLPKSAAEKPRFSEMIFREGKMHFYFALRRSAQRTYVPRFLARVHITALAANPQHRTLRRVERAVLERLGKIVEDDPMIAQAIKGALADEMYTVEQVANGRDALMMLSLNDYGFVLLDLGLPGVDGMTVLRTLRANAEGNKKTVPVIILTARDGLDDRLEGLDAGADDYLVKPFHISELLARIRAVLRRKNQINENSLTNGVVTLDVVQKTALLASNPTPITLSRREYGLLAALLARPGTILSRRKIEERIYEPGEEPESNAVEYLIHSLRKNL